MQGVLTAPCSVLAERDVRLLDAATIIFLHKRPHRNKTEARSLSLGSSRVPSQAQLHTIEHASVSWFESLG